jgi:hypothetical protein
MNNELLLSLLNYDKHSGVFTWSENQHRGVRGKNAGTIDKEGYLILSVKKKKYKAHRVAWFFSYGVFPYKEIDHIDGNKLNNAIQNLREVTRSENQSNIYKPQSINKLGLRGVCKHRNKFMADIKVNGKKVYLGLFDTAELAHQAYLNAKKELHL